MKFKHLLAKSLPENKSWYGWATFTGHTAMVMRAGDVLLEKLGQQIIDLLALKVDYQTFASTVKLGNFTHDWGKANQHFQVMMRIKGKEPPKGLQRYWNEIGQRQILRHEIISGILTLSVPSYREWLEQCPDADLMTAIWAGMGHHVKLGVKYIDKKQHKIDSIANQIVRGTGDELEIYTDHSDFRALLKMGVKRLNLPKELPSPAPTTWTKKQLKGTLESLTDEFNQWIDLHEEDEDYQRFLAAVKATVVVSDIAGSGLPNVHENKIESWLEEVLDLVLTETDIQSLLDQRLGKKTLRKFQEKIAESRSRVTLAIAGCGTGKTVGAYAWAKKNAVGKRLFFCYPTTGTATQGFLDYAAETEIESLLMHSRAKIDLEGVVFSHEGELEKNPDDDEDAERIDARLGSFQTWQSKLIVATVDSVLGLMQNNRKPLYAWTAICQSAFVFDEVHAFDHKLFGALLRFIKTFRNAKILLMSASFTEGQLQAIRDCLAELGEDLEELEGAKNLEELERYTLHQINSKDNAWQPVISALQENKKVLWVTNTVNSCISIYENAIDKLKKWGIKPLIYHSCFRYQDRVSKHQQVINAFKPENNEPVLAITTQVCEMSLDLSADMLVSAQAPATALIQRLGRLNRRKVSQEDSTICPAYFYPWTNDKPYEPENLKTGEELLNLLPDKTISQADLANASASLNSNVPKDVFCTWLDGYWRSYPQSLRKAGYTITVLLENDLHTIRQQASLNNHSFGVEAQRWTVPIPIVFGYSQWQREGVYPVAPKEIVEYSRLTGAKVIKNDNN